MKKLYRSKQNKKILGIAGGLGDFYNIDPTIIRLILILLCIITGVIPMILAYFIAALIIPIEPKEHEEVKYQRLFLSQTDKKIAGLCGGIAKLLEVDSTIVRLITIMVCIITGVFPLLFVYFIGWIIIPKEIVAQ